MLLLKYYKYLKSLTSVLLLPAFKYFHAEGKQWLYINDM